jgi:hypothetical protein
MRRAGDISRGRRLAAWVGGALAGVALAALGWLWHLDRTRVWQTPGLGAPLVLVRTASSDSSAGTWLVAVNPDCPHCLQELARLAARPRRGLRVGALIVDTPRRPGAAALATLRAAPLWWDARGDWRRRWGHRVYGEVLCFDPRGRYVKTRFAD